MKKLGVLILAIVMLTAYIPIAAKKQENVDWPPILKSTERVSLAELRANTTCFFPSPVINDIEANLQGFTFDGQHYWATVETTDHPPGQIPPGKILKLDADTFAVLQTFDHQSTAPTGITYNPDEDIIVTNAAVGGPPKSPWKGGTDYFFIHDPKTLTVTATYTAPSGINSVFYNAASGTYFSIEVVNGTLSEHLPDDFSIINSYQLPGAPHHPKGLTMIPDRDGGSPYILVGYYPEPSGGLGEDLSGYMIQIMQIVDNQLLLVQTLRAIDGYIFAATGDLTWVAPKQMLVTSGVPWLLNQMGMGQVGIYLHNNATGCNPLHGIPP